MDGSVQRTDDGTPIAVMPVDYRSPPMTIEKLSAAVPMQYALAVAALRKSGGDLSYESYAAGFALLVSELVGAGIDPASPFR